MTNLLAGFGRHADQGEVWEAVAYELDRLDAGNDSGSLIGAHMRSNGDHRLAEATKQLVEYGPLAGQCGVVIAHGSRIVAAELFVEPDLLAAHWEALVRGTLLDAPAAPTGNDRRRVVRCGLRRVASSDTVDNDAVGLAANITSVPTASSPSVQRGTTG